MRDRNYDEYKQKLRESLDLSKLPPQASDLEMAVLGAILMESECVYKIGKLIPEMMYKESNSIILQAIFNLRDNNEPIDMLTTVQELKRMNKLEDVGGAYYIAQLTSNIGGTAHIDVHASIVVEKYVRREIIKTSSQTQSAAYDESIPLSELIGMSTNVEVSSIIDGSNEIKSFSENLNNTVNVIKKEVKDVANGGFIGVPAPLPKMSAMIGGFEPWIIILAGRPGMGKTQFAIFCAKHQAKMGFNPMFCSLEMTSLSLTKRMLLAETGISSEKMIQRKLSPYDIEKLEKAAKHLGKYNIWIDDSSENSPHSIKAKAAEKKRQGKCDILYIDYLQITNTDGYSNENEAIRLGKAMKVFRSIVKDLEIPVVVLSQVNRNTENRAGAEGKKPGMGDLKGSGAIEQDADLIYFLHRPEYYKIYEDADGNDLRGKTELIAGKFRHGSISNIMMDNNITMTGFEESDRQSTPQEEQITLDFSGNQPYGNNKKDMDDIPFFNERPFE